MKINKSILTKVDEVLDRFPNVDVTKMKTHKNGRTDITFKVCGNNDGEIELFLKNRFHPYEMKVDSFELFSKNEGCKIRLFDVMH